MSLVGTGMPDGLISTHTDESCPSKPNAFTVALSSYGQAISPRGRRKSGRYQPESN
jgi:hypothetical protein